MYDIMQKVVSIYQTADVEVRLFRQLAIKTTFSPVFQMWKSSKIRHRYELLKTTANL